MEMHQTVVIQIGSHTEEAFWVPTNMLWILSRAVECVKTAGKKNQDYSQRDQWCDNFIGGGLRGIYDRMGDKMQRLRNLLKNDFEGAVEDESFEDTCHDLATYALILAEASQMEDMSFEGENWKK